MFIISSSHANSGFVIVSVVEMCMGMGFPFPVGFQWESHKNENMSIPKWGWE